jgi:hypothetical protein
MSGEIEAAIEMAEDWEDDGGGREHKATKAARAELAALQEENARLLGNQEAARILERDCAALRADNARLRAALEGLYRHTKNNVQICGLNEAARAALSTKPVGESVTPAPAGAFVTLEQLREIEWESEGCDMDGGEAVVSSTCPACGGAHPKFAPNRPRLLGHAPDCWLAAAIRDAEKEKT